MALDKSDQNQQALPKEETTTTDAPNRTDALNIPNEESFFKKNQKVLLLVAIAVVGYFAYKKFNK